MILRLEVPGVPVAKKRARHFKVGSFIKTYNPQRSVEGTIISIVQSQLPNDWVPSKGRVKISCIFHLQRPKNHYGTGKNSNKIKSSAPDYHTSTPDIDNLQKMVFDCLNKIVWYDDSHVCESHSVKRYSENPKTEITIEIDD